MGLRAAWWCVVSVSARSMTAHKAHTQHEQGIGSEYGVDVVLAGSAEGREKKARSVGQDVTTPPPPPHE